MAETYQVSSDLRTITLNSFGTLTIKKFNKEDIEMTLTPTGASPIELKIVQQTIVTPPTSTDKKIKKIEMIDNDEDHTTYIFTYTDGKLTFIDMSAGKESLKIPIIHQKDKVYYEVEGELAIGKKGVFKITYTLNSAGLASLSTIEKDNSLLTKINYTYNNNRQLISFRSTNKNGKVIQYCNATWRNNNIESTYTWSTHTCNAEFDEHDGIKYYYHDHNRDGKYDDQDKKTSEDYSKSYSYTAQVNKGGYMSPMSVPDIYDSSDFFDVIGQWIGVLGISSKNLMPEHVDGDGNFTYTLDKDGYPIRLDVSYPKAPKDNWYVIQTYE